MKSSEAPPAAARGGWGRTALAFCAFFAFGLGAYLATEGGHVHAIRARTQPFAFNHRVHTKNADCTLCHRGSRTGTRAGLPDLAMCQGCHKTAPGKTPTTEQTALWAQVATGDVPAWNRLYRVPDHVFFSHRRHVTVGKLKCERCHGDMAHQQRPPRFTLERLKMRDCISCHEERKVSSDCTACHR